MRGARHRARLGAQSGLSLIEVVVALAIVGLLVGGATTGVRALVRSELRQSAGRLGAAIRYSYDRAVTTGAYYRLHLNLDDQTYRLERSDARVLLSSEKERVTHGRGADLDEEAKRAAKDEEAKSGTTSGLPQELLPPPSPRRPKFEEFKDTALPLVRLRRIKILDIVTARQAEPYVAGHAYLHFFPDGHTERAVIHMGVEAQDQDEQYTLMVHGLTGRVEVLPGHVPPPRDFDADDGHRRGER